MPSFKVRTTEDELMDDFSITDSRLTDALDQLRWVNQFLGGYTAPMAILKPLLKAQARANQSGQAAPVRILDLGTGIADFPEVIVRWAARQSPAPQVEIVAVDANPVTVAYAQKALSDRLPPALLPQIQVEVADALALPYADNSFDVVMASMFLHHFAQENAIAVVAAMNRIARNGIIINDLQRHPLAYLGIYSLTRILRASPMMQNDGPVSVLRGFRANELAAIAQGAALPTFSLQWRWAFRWLLSTVTIGECKS
jgi:2-polyprenyl-3-methyl-5-hydroxy-6-metoxy-1,4-benzoquinol methylase